MTDPPPPLPERPETFEAFADDWVAFREEHRAWCERVNASLRTLEVRQVDQYADIKHLQSARWVTTAIYSRAPAWISCSALVAIAALIATH